MPPKVVEYVVDFKNRRFQIEKAHSHEVIHRFSPGFLALLFRECGRMWLSKTPCPTNDCILKKRSLSIDEWETKLDEVSRVPVKYRHLVRHHGDWINRYEFHFCGRLFDHLSS